MLNNEGEEEETTDSLSRDLGFLFPMKKCGIFTFKGEKYRFSLSLAEFQPATSYLGLARAG